MTNELAMVPQAMAVLQLALFFILGALVIGWAFKNHVEKILIGAAVVLALLWWIGQANASTVELKRGLAGTAVARMDGLAAKFRHAGWHVRVSEWYEPTGKADLVVGHSLGAGPALASGARRVITIDPPTPLVCPPRTRCTNFYAMARVEGARNIPVSGIAHTAMPDVLAGRIVRASHF